MRNALLNEECSDTSIGVSNRLLLYLVSNLVSMYCKSSPKAMWPDDYASTAIEFGTDAFDYIVIGYGTAGSVIANRLSENPENSVLVIEAGGDPPIESQIPGLGVSTQGSQFDWAYPTKTNGKSCFGMVDENCVWPAGKVLGGTSATGGMLYSRGNSRDYNEWARKGNDHWNWKTVLDYFKLMENFREENKYGAHGINGPVSIESYKTPTKDQDMILDAAQELGYPLRDDFVEGQYTGFGYLYGFLENGRRYSSALAYMAKDRSNLKIIKNAVATKINFDSQRKTKSVKFVINNSLEMTMNVKKEVIVSAGTIESPKLLMLSGIGPKNHLKYHNIPLVYDSWVGSNLHDHTTVDLFLKLEGQEIFNRTSLMDAIYNQMVHNVRPQGVGILNVGAFTNTTSHDRFPDIQFHYFPVPNVKKFAARYKKPIRDSIVRQIGPNDRLIVCNVALLKPKSRGTVRLKSPDYRDKPIIYHNSLDDERDLQKILSGLENQLDFERTRAFWEYHGEFLKIDLPDCKMHSYRSNEYWRCYLKYMSGSMFHYVGTVKMGPVKDREAVVNEHLEVYGANGLRVVDASIMPEIVSGNINGPVIMIAEKGSDDILGSSRVRTTQ